MTSLSVCLKLLLMITAMRRTEEEIHIPEVVDRTFNSEHPIPCRLDRMRSETLQFVHGSATNTTRLMDPMQLLPTADEPLRIETILILPSQISDPQFICKILEDPSLSTCYMNTRLDYSKHCIVLESFNLHLSQITPSKALKIDKSKAWASFFHSVSSLLVALPSQKLFESLKGVRDDGMQVIVSVGASSRDDILPLASGSSVSNYMFDSPPHSSSSNYTLSIQHLIPSASLSLIRNLRCLLRKLPSTTARTSPPPFLDISFLRWPLLYHPTPSSPPPSGPPSRGFKLPVLKLPTLFESRPPSPTPSQSSIPAQREQRFLRRRPSTETLKQAFKARFGPGTIHPAVEEIPTVHIDRLTKTQHQYHHSMSSVSASIVTRSSLDFHASRGSTLSASLVFDIRRTSFDASGRFSMESHSWLTRSSISSLPPRLSSSTEAIGINASHLEIMSCLSKNGYMLHMKSSDEPVATDWYENPPWVSPQSTSITHFKHNSAFVRPSMSSESTHLSFHTALNELYRESTTSLSSSYLALTSNDINMNPHASCSTLSLTQSFYSAILFEDTAAGFYSTHDTRSNDTNMNPNTREYTYPNDESEPNANGLSNPDATHHLIQQRASNHTYHIHLHYYGDTYHGPIHGGIVGGRRNSNVIAPPPTLVSDIETILRPIPGWSQSGANGDVDDQPLLRLGSTLSVASHDDSC
ncbi:hypothetical protein ONZ45_g12298 [Pleurotus djamor]|nr:hypothetical protein ONZ45_g12298 [Pleurotus djamor]